MPSAAASQQVVASTAETDRLLLALAPVLTGDRPRTRSKGAFDALENAALAVELEERARHTAERLAANRLWRIVVLAPVLEVCEALCRGERVPRSRFDQRAAKAFRL